MSPRERTPDRRRRGLPADAIPAHPVPTDPVGRGPVGASAGALHRRERSESPVGLGAILGALGRERPLRAGMTLGRLGRRWSDVVGERLAGETAPLRLEGGRLVVGAVSAAWGAQVRFLAGLVAERANQVLGEEAVREVAVVVRPDDGRSRRGGR